MAEDKEKTQQDEVMFDVEREKTAGARYLLRFLNRFGEPDRKYGLVLERVYEAISKNPELGERLLKFIERETGVTTDTSSVDSSFEENKSTGRFGNSASRKEPFDFQELKSILNNPPLFEVKHEEFNRFSKPLNAYLQKVGTHLPQPDDPKAIFIREILGLSAKYDELFQIWKREEKANIEAEYLRETRDSQEKLASIREKTLRQSFNLGISAVAGLVFEETLLQIAERLKENQSLLVSDKADLNQWNFSPGDKSLYQSFETKKDPDTVLLEKLRKNPWPLTAKETNLNQQNFSVEDANFLSKIEKDWDAAFVSGFAYQVAKEVAEKNLVEPFKKLAADFGFSVITRSHFETESAPIVENLIRDHAQRDNVKEEVLSLVFENRLIEKPAKGTGVDF